jgi:hypothetical protein
MNLVELLDVGPPLIVVGRFLQLLDHDRKWIFAAENFASHLKHFLIH